MLYVLINYLLGSIPFGFILVKIFQKSDIREIGSKNIGATNVMRTGSKTLALFTFLLDAMKGTLAAYVSTKYLYDNQTLFSISIIAVIIGHMFPVWLKFKGGKGISTNFGLMLYLSPFVFLISLLTWLGIFKFTKISSISGLSAMTISSIIVGINLFPNYSHLFQSYLVISLLIIFKHKENIIRLTNGNEKSFK